MPSTLADERATLLKRPEARQLLRDVASFRAALRDLKASETLSDTFDSLSDAIECFGWIGGTASVIYARLMLDGFQSVDARLAKIEPKSPHAAISERITLWRIAKSMGLLRREINGKGPDPVVELLHDAAANAHDNYRRLALAWSLYGERQGDRELSMLFYALRRAELYHLEKQYRDRHNQRRDFGNVSLRAAQQRALTETALAELILLLPELPGLRRDLSSLRALLSSSVEQLAAKADCQDAGSASTQAGSAMRSGGKATPDRGTAAAHREPAPATRSKTPEPRRTTISVPAIAKPAARSAAPAPPLPPDDPDVAFRWEPIRNAYYVFPKDDPAHFFRISNLGYPDQEVRRMTQTNRVLQDALWLVREKMRERVRAAFYEYREAAKQSGSTAART